MKKIFAFILATIMVLSLVPASAFAAVTKCPDTHTSTNCDCTLLYTVPADCETVGYQAFVCNDCDVQFVDNLKPKAEHAWASNPKLAANDINANCVYKTNGVQHLVCAICDEEWTKTVDYRSTSVHNLVLVSGVGCEKLYSCTLCGAKGFIGENADGDAILTDEVSHNWEFTEVETEPYWKGGKKYSGLAVYTCKDCGAIKKVTIDTPTCHESNTAGSVPPEDYTVVLNPNNAVCGVKGHYLIVKCADCGELWYCTSQTCADNHKEYKDHVWASADTDDDYDYTDHSSIKEFAALKHKEYVGGPDNGDTNNCGRSYYCILCNTWQTEDHDYEDLGDANGNPLVVNATCTTDGYKYRKCKDCGYIGKQTLGKTGHDSKNDTYKVTFPATCANPAMSFYVCKNDNCTIVPTLINGTLYKVNGSITYTGNVNADAHVWTTIPGVSTGSIEMGNPNPDLYCSGISYEFKICANGCAEYGSGQAVMTDPVLHDLYVCYSAHNFTNAHGGLAAFHTQVKYACKKCNYVSKPQDILDTVLYKNTFESRADALEWFGYTKRTYTYDATEDKVKLVKEEIRALYSADYTSVDALFAAKFTQIGLPTTATCQTPASITYAVPEYGTYITITGQKLNHVPAQTIPGTESTCTTPGTHTTYICKNCGVTYWQDTTGEQYTTSPVKNPCFDTVVFVPGSCGEENGFWQCAKCNTCYTDATCSEKCVPSIHDYVTLLAGVAATCNTTGRPEIRYCAVCGALEINLIYMNGGNELRVNFNTANVKYKEGTAVAAITKDWLSAAVTVVVNLDGTVTFNYAGDEWVEWPSAVTVKKMETSSNHRGIYTNIIIADDPVETNSVLATGVISVTNVYWANSEHEIPTEFKELDHTKPSFDLVYCDACVYEFIRDYTPAQGGHVNDKGNLITDDCADGAKGGRECLTCKRYYADIAESEGVDVEEYAEYYTFGAHNMVESTDSTYTCQSAGYMSEFCTKCGYFYVDTDSYEPANAKKYHNAIKTAVKDALESGDFWELIAVQKYTRGNPADYAQNGTDYYVCDVCEEVLIAPTNTPCPGTGLEINMATEYDEYMPNSYIELVISLDSLKGVNAWGVSFNVGYNPEVVKFVSADFSASPFSINKANAVSGPSYTYNSETGLWVPSTAKVPYGIVSIASNSESGVDLKGDNDYVVLVFQVIEANYDNQFSIGYVRPFGADVDRHPLSNTYYTANAVGANGKVIKVNYNVTKNEPIPGYIVSVNNKVLSVTTTSFLDFDGDKELTIFDAFELYYLIETDEYSVLADADHDGDVDTDDLDILYQVLVGEKTLADILNPEDEEEKERVITYDENGFVTYDSLYDLNDDGVLNAYEIAVMTGKIDADLLNPAT